MKFKDLLKELEQLNLPKGEFAILGSGGLGIRKIRESNDLDIIVKESLWKELCKKYPKNTNTKIQIGNIEICKDWKPWLENTEKIIDECEIIKKYPFVRLDTVLLLKKKTTREKDKKDVELIEKYLKEQSKKPKYNKKKLIINTL